MTREYLNIIKRWIFESNHTMLREDATASADAGVAAATPIFENLLHKSKYLRVLCTNQTIKIIRKTFYVPTIKYEIPTYHKTGGCINSAHITHLHIFSKDHGLS